MNQKYSRIRLPEYTGENRCIPCTIVNLVVAAVVSGLLGFASVPLAFGTFVVFVVIIYLRGYLVPGTPTLTKRYLPDRVLRWFGKEPMPNYTVDADTEDELDVEDVLLCAGALEESADPGDLEVTPDFEETWRSQIDRLDDSTTRETLATMLDVSESRVSTEEFSEAFAVSVDVTQIGRWECRAAFEADIAAGIALSDRINGWDDLTVQQQTGLMRGMRVFLTKCPACSGRVKLTVETVESCCSSKDVLTSTCQDCGARLFRMNAAKVEQERS